MPVTATRAGAVVVLDSLHVVFDWSATIISAGSPPAIANLVSYSATIVLFLATWCVAPYLFECAIAMLGNILAAHTGINKLINNGLLQIVKAIRRYAYAIERDLTKEKRRRHLPTQ